jgi:hypothetical protein
MVEEVSEQMREALEDLAKRERDLLKRMLEGSGIPGELWLGCLLRACADIAEFMQMSDEEFVAHAREMYEGRHSRRATGGVKN